MSGETKVATTLASVSADPVDGVESTDWIEWSEIEWNAQSAEAFFALGACDDGCEHPHSHFENLRAGVYACIDTIEEDSDLTDQAEYLRESLTPIFSATTARIEALVNAIAAERSRNQEMRERVEKRIDADNLILSLPDSDGALVRIVRDIGAIVKEYADA